MITIVEYSASQQLSSHARSCAVVLCSEDSELQTGYKSLHDSNMYPIQIFVNVTYSFTDCQMSNCTGDLELQIELYHNGYTRTSHNIQNNREASSGTRKFVFGADTLTQGFYLKLKSNQGCVTVSRVLVYHFQCPGHDRQSTGLGRPPATPAPVTGAVVISTEMCYIYDFPHTTVQKALICTSQGKWLECEYSENEVTCKGKL